MIRRAILTALTSVLLVPVSHAAEADWPEWRGRNRDDISPDKGLLSSWPEGGPALAWKATGLGGGYSGVSMVGPRIYTMGERGDSSHVLSISRKDGKILWTTKVGRSGAVGWGDFSGPRSTPTVDGDRIYALGHFGELVCVAAEDGTEIWRQTYQEDLGSPLPEWGFSESPLADGDRLICMPGGAKGTLAALDKLTGKVIWRTKDLTDTATYSSIIAADLQGVRQFIVLTDKCVAGIAADGGRVLWRAPRQGEVAVIPTPIVHGDRVYVSSGYGVGSNLFKITKAGDTFTAKEEYASKVMVNHHGGIVLVGEHLYGYSDGKGWTCQNLATGKAVWMEEQKLGKGSLTYADGRLYLRQEDGPGTIALIEATPEGYRERGRFQQPDRSEANSWPHPVVAGGKLYIRDQDVLLCYDVLGK